MVLENINSDILVNENKLIAAVYMITYNQENFIEQAIESVVNQKTDFTYKLFIGEDCSTDKTREICLSLKEKYPHKIDLILNDTNLGIVNNAKNIFKHSLGSNAEYIALIEGDDYWTDPLKLQKQVDFMEKNPDYSIIFHKVTEVDLHGVPTDTILNSPDHEETYDIHKLASGNFIHTPSVLFKKNFHEFPEWINISPVVDYPLHMLNAQYGLIKYLPEEMAAYRIGAGIWSSQSRIHQFVNTLFTLKLLITYFSDQQEIKENLSIQYNLLMKELRINDLNTASCLPEKKQNDLSFRELTSLLVKKIKKRIRI